MWPTTNQDGRFTFEQLPDGEHELKATLDRFVPAVRAMRLVNGETEPLVLQLSVGAFERVLVTAEEDRRARPAVGPHGAERALRDGLAGSRRFTRWPIWPGGCRLSHSHRTAISAS